jgi:uncharacterized membrane protein
MPREHAIYLIYLLLLAVLMGLIIATPLLSFTGDMSGYYKAFSVTCHQKISRSTCLFSDGRAYWLSDCTPQSGTYITDENDREQVKVESDGTVGYKLPVCARDVGIYGAMLFGALAYPLVRKLEERRVYPAIYLVLAIVPLALDGSVQLASDMGLLPFAYESTNAIRLLTGAIAGFAASFYAIPILINMFSEERKAPEKAGAGKLKKAE